MDFLKHDLSYKILVNDINIYLVKICNVYVKRFVMMHIFRMLHNKGLRDLYVLPNTVRVMKYTLLDVPQQSKPHLS